MSNRNQYDSKRNNASGRRQRRDQDRVSVYTGVSTGSSVETSVPRQNTNLMTSALASLVSWL